MTLSKRPVHLAILGLCVLSLLPSCGILPFPRDVAFDEAAWTAAKAKWDAAGLENYSYRQTSAGFMLFDSVFTISGGVAVAEALPANADPERDTLTGRLMSIDDWFTDIYESWEENDGRWATDMDCPLVGIAVEYDADLGYPTKIDFSYDISPFVAWDGNPSWSLSELIPAE